MYTYAVINTFAVTVLTVRFHCMAPKKRDAKSDSQKFRIKSRIEAVPTFAASKIEVSRCKRECWRQTLQPTTCLFGYFIWPSIRHCRVSVEALSTQSHCLIFRGVSSHMVEFTCFACDPFLWCKGPRFANRDRFGWSAIHSMRFVSVKRIMHFQFWKCCWQERHQMFSRLCHLHRFL